MPVDRAGTSRTCPDVRPGWEIPHDAGSRSCGPASAEKGRMMRAIGSLGAILALSLAVVQGGCAADAGVSCSPGQTLRCSCNGSLTGQATCDSSGHESACDCSGASDDSGGGSGPS